MNVENIEVDNAEKASVESGQTAGQNVEAQLDQLRIERDGLKAERDEMKELLLRRQAEFDNYRKRTERERSDYLQFAGMEAIRDMLPVLDDFERALNTPCPTAEYAKGVEMIYSRMYETLRKMGLEPMDAEGKEFDPNLHEAVERVEKSDAPDNSILGEFRKGYFFKGRLLRPAMVKVAVRS